MNPSLSVNAYFYMSLHRLTDARLCHRRIGFKLLFICYLLLSLWSCLRDFALQS